MTLLFNNNEPLGERSIGVFHLVTSQRHHGLLSWSEGTGVGRMGRGITPIDIITSKNEVQKACHTFLWITNWQVIATVEHLWCLCSVSSSNLWLYPHLS